MKGNLSFHTEYRKLEERMKKRAEDDGDVFLPNSEPQGQVNYVLICMEPSRGRWARTPDEARLKIESGFRNFLPSDEVTILHFCIRRYLCRPGERYHITDLSKGAMFIERANFGRGQRWNRWFPLLEEEIDLVATPSACIVAVGAKVQKYLKRRGFSRPYGKIVHYSPLAARAWAKGIADYEDKFQAFKDSVSRRDLRATAQDVLASARVPAEIRNQTLSRLAKFSLTVPRQKLIFNYKRAFKSIRRNGGVSPRHRPGSTGEVPM